MATIMPARFAGFCSRTKARILPGDLIEHHGRGKQILVKRRTVSDTVETSGGTFYRNRNGRCEDAPCCGCCTI